MDLIKYDFLRPLKAKYLQDCYKIFANGEHPLNLELINSATIIPPTTETGVVTVLKEDGALHPFCYEDEDMPEVDEPGNLPIEYPNQTVLFAGYLDPHWGHFLMDSLSRLWPVFSSNIIFHKIIFASPFKSIKDYAPNIREALHLAGIEDKIELINTPHRFANLAISQRAISPRHFACQEANLVFDAIRQCALRDKTEEKEIQTTRGIFMSRSHLPKASANEPGIKWLDKYFENNDFEVIYPERLSLSELIVKMHGAETVIAMSGSLPHNLVFGRSGTRTWIIEKTPVINNYQVGIDRLRELDVTYIDASALIWTTSAGLGPFIVYPNALFCKFANSENLIPPPLWSGKMKRNALSQFVKMYKRHYSRQWMLDKWEEEEIGLLREAWRDTMSDFGPWISGELPITHIDALNPRNILKRLYHKILKIR